MLLRGSGVFRGFPLNLQVKQYVVELNGRWGARFRVFTTGDDKYYLFDLLDPYGCSTTIQFPVRKADLKREVRSALAHGWGHAPRMEGVGG